MGHFDESGFVFYTNLGSALRNANRLEEAAGELNLSVAQLRKRLYRSGTSYKKLVLEIRMALARHYLAETDE